MADQLRANWPSLELGTGPSGPFVVDANLLATGRTCVLGSSGSGKSYTVGVLCEELLRGQIPFTVIDTEGEHTGLKEKFEAIWVGDDPESDILWERLDLDDLAAQAPDISSLILDVSESQEPKVKISEFVTSLYKTLTERRTPYLLIVEEADKFIPQAGDRVPIFAEVARRGRKRGLGLMICSQRPSLVDKNVLSQCGNQLIGKLIIQNDLHSVEQFFPGRGLPKELTRLKAGEFYAMGGLSPIPTLVNVKGRTTRPGGFTPMLGTRVVRKYVAQGSRQPSPGSRPSGTEKRENLIVGLKPSTKLEDVPALVRRERSFGIFGPRETVTNVELSYRTLVQLGVRIRRGLLKRRFETAYLHLDGTTGREVSVGRGLDMFSGFERLLGLNALQVEVLSDVHPDSDTSAIDIAEKTGESRSTVSRILGQLNDRRLVRSIEVRKKKLFRRLVDLPREPTLLVPLTLEEVEIGRGTLVHPKIKEEDVREAVKGLWDGADVETFETFAYPMFKVELFLRKRRRVVWLDGRSGKELSF